MRARTSLQELNFPTEAVACSACDSDAGERLYAGPGQHGLPVSVACCRECGLVYLSPRWTKAGYNAFYSDVYDVYYGRRTVGDAQAPDAVSIERQKAQSAIRDLADSGVRGVTRHLDIGAGFGGLVAEVRQQLGAPALKSYAIEASQDGRASLQADGVTLIDHDAEGGWASQVAEGEGFDLVTMRHVLEHLLNPVHVLRDIAASLAPGGTVYIAVPNNAKPPAKQPLRTYWFRAVHTYYFTEQHLAYMASRVGLTLINSGEHGSEVWVAFQRGESQLAKPRLYAEQRGIMKKALAADFLRPTALLRLVKARLAGLRR